MSLEYKIEEFNPKTASDSLWEGFYQLYVHYLENNGHGIFGSMALL